MSSENALERVLVQPVRDWFSERTDACTYALLVRAFPRVPWPREPRWPSREGARAYVAAHGSVALFKWSERVRDVWNWHTPQRRVPSYVRHTKAQYIEYLRTAALHNNARLLHWLWKRGHVAAGGGDDGGDEHVSFVELRLVFRACAVSTNARMAAFALKRVATYDRCACARVMWCAKCCWRRELNALYVSNWIRRCRRATANDTTHVVHTMARYVPDFITFGHFFAAWLGNNVAAVRAIAQHHAGVRAELAQPRVLDKSHALALLMAAPFDTTQCVFDDVLVPRSMLHMLFSTMRLAQVLPKRAAAKTAERIRFYTHFAHLIHVPSVLLNSALRAEL